ncbi:alpha/beta hydrolase [Rhodoplanes sp. Z2-YC6860]|uniref:alpha/beta hydrolase n=1 Tax=Rhodoplanes sp. Z2-YC6860 TaxID=674703 RepID=UPI00078D79B3|nr:alpha/beta hydrolase [Rhodoplanes sp. Z2-YC6860]AMN40821.1 esterase/lipase [Rhodoplanes sp. Z2-YC6860]
MAESETRRRLRWPWLLPAGVVGLLAASVFSPALVPNLLAKLQSYDRVTNIAYAQGERHRLDVYRAHGMTARPVLVFFYGGSWQAGSKDMYAFLASTLAARGYVVIVPDYRVYPEVKFPVFLEDGAEAVRWTRDNATAFGGDPSRIFIMGHSAGAHIAAMLALDDEWLRGVGLSPSRDISGLIGVSGPYDFLPLKDDNLKVIFGGDNRAQTQPITFAKDASSTAKGDKPAALLLTGSADTTVSPRNSEKLAAALRANGNVATEVVYPKLGHISILLAFAPFVSRFFPALDEIDAFVGGAKSSPASAARPTAAVVRQ